MSHILKSIPLAFRMILKDPVNLLLALFPTVIALALYALTVYVVFNNTDSFVALFRDYIYTADQATVLAKILTVVLIIFIFFVMSWTFVIVVGIISAPFNSMLSSRIEKNLVLQVVDPDKKEAFQKIGQSLGQTFKNELKKLIFIVIVAAAAFVLNLFPLFYPVGIFLVACLVAVQFIDYSWSRHDMHFGACLKDLTLNIIPYSVSGFFFLLLVTVPIINAFVPALATSYYTVLWLHRQNKIQ
ncbi:MAG: EI24 domain-containing protein [Bdellovibrionales bacterium]|nr:EI24 domain-containing protein [Bdellovibrionales bacterium]